MLKADGVENGKYSSTQVTMGTKAVEGVDYKITEPELFDKDGNKNFSKRDPALF